MQPGQSKIKMQITARSYLKKTLTGWVNSSVTSMNIFLKKNKLSIPDGNEKIKDMSQIMFSILISLKLYFKTRHWYQQSF